MKMLALVLYACACWLALLSTAAIAGAPLAALLAFSPFGVSAFVLLLAAVDLLLGDGVS